MRKTPTSSQQLSQSTPMSFELLQIDKAPYWPPSRGCSIASLAGSNQEELTHRSKTSAVPATGHLQEVRTAACELSSFGAAVEGFRCTGPSRDPSPAEGGQSDASTSTRQSCMLEQLVSLHLGIKLSAADRASSSCWSPSATPPGCCHVTTAWKLAPLTPRWRAQSPGPPWSWPRDEDQRALCPVRLAMLA